MSTLHADIEALVRTGESQLGIAENPPYSNRTPYCTWYGLVGPWCAMFVSWVFAHSGNPLPAIRTSKGFSYCPDAVNWAKREGLWRPSTSSYQPKRGDIVLFDFIGRPSHVGIVTGRTADGRVQTIEGNTNGSGHRDGGSVMRHNRSRSGSTIGYIEVTPRGARPPVVTPPTVPQEDEFMPKLTDSQQEQLYAWARDAAAGVADMQAHVNRRAVAVRSKADGRVWVVSPAGRWWVRSMTALNLLIFVGQVEGFGTDGIAEVDQSWLDGIVEVAPPEGADHL